MNKLFAKFLSVISKYKKIYIQTHNYPDPDAIASAFALQYILSYYNISSKIIYAGDTGFSHLDFMIKTLNIKAYNINKIKLNKNIPVFLVDAQKENANVKSLPLNYIGVIDHHPPVNKFKYMYSDIRPEIGACSTIIAQYIIKFIKPENLPEEIATALVIGVRVDTANLLRKTTNVDIEIFKKLTDFADDEKVNKVIINVMRMKDLKFFKQAMDSLMKYNDGGFFKITGSKDRTLLALIADFFLQIKELNFIAGFSENKKNVLITARSEVERYNSLDFILSVVDGVGTGGGHNTMSAGIVNKKYFNSRYKTTFEKYFYTKLKKFINNVH